jgi:hypothetical protein
VKSRKDSKSRWKRSCAPTSPTIDFYYSLPNSKLLTILLIVSIALVIIFFCLFKHVTKNWCAIRLESNASVTTYLSIIGVPIGIILSFIVATAWSSFADAQAKETEEASDLLLLYNIVSKIPLKDASKILRDIKKYTKIVIDVEFPMMATGQTSTEELNLILSIGDQITSLTPTTPKETSLYNHAIALYQKILSLRVIRYDYVLYGLAPELWWVLILGVVLIVFLSFFLYCKSLILQCMITCVVTVGLVSLLFLIVALNFPYRGDFGLDSVPFQIALANMNRKPRKPK